MNIFQRISFRFYIAWILFEGVRFFGSVEAWRKYAWFELSLMYFVCFLSFVVLLQALLGAPFLNFYRWVIMTHQLLLGSISICKMFTESRYETVWYGVRLVLIVTCALLDLTHAANGSIAGLVKNHTTEIGKLSRSNVGF